MPQQSFAASVKLQAEQAKGAMVAIRNESAQRVIEIMQTPVAKGGNMPVDTGFLRASLHGFTGNTAPALRDNPGGEARYNFDAGDIILLLARTPLSEPVTVAYTANYAIHQEYGAKGREGKAFVRLAAQQWPSIVNAVASEISKGRLA